MKFKSLFAIVAITAIFLSSGVQNQSDACVCKKSKQVTFQNLVGTPTDYSQKSNWMYLDTNPKHEVDLFYIYPTIIVPSANDKDLSIINDEYKKGAQGAFVISGSAFSSYTNVYAPYYRQLPITKAVELGNGLSYEKYIMKSEVRTDIYAALDTYFTKYNNGRPFIIAGHSQGSAIIKMVLSEYMKAHPEYLKRMVAAYPIGYSITKYWLQTNKHIKFAQKEDDTGVVVSWNTEGPDAVMNSYVVLGEPVVINPLNWKRDETPATIEENKGSLNTKTLKVEKGVADATINLKRGVVVCTTRKDYVPSDMFDYFFGDKSFHHMDYPFYYANIQENGLKRIEKFLGHPAK